MDGERTWAYGPARVAVWVIVGALPMAGLASLLLRSQLDPHIENYPLHFVVFGIVGAFAFALGYAAGEAANRRGDARVLLLSLAFMATGGFLLLHAIGTRPSSSRRSARVSRSRSPSASSSARCLRWDRGSSTRPELADAVIATEGCCGAACWPRWPAGSDGRREPAAVRRSRQRGRRRLLAPCGCRTQLRGSLRCGPGGSSGIGVGWLAAAVVACFALLAQAMIGVAVAGERKWHASWWEWHGLILLAYAVVGLRRPARVDR